jgi:hypothetical protein
MTESELSPGVQRLRKVVITMGFVLVIGTIALFIAAYFKFTNKKIHTQKPLQIVSTIDKCAFKPNSDLEINGKIINSDINGNIMTIITTQQIILFDLCKGEALSRINVTAD